MFLVYICSQKDFDMAEMKFHIQRYTKSGNGLFVKDGVSRSLEDDFGYIRYKSMTGLNSRGKQKGVYVETYAEADSARVWFADSAKREQVSSTLTVCCFGSAPELPTDKSEAELALAASVSWNGLLDWMENRLLLWTDDYRQRKALFYLSDAVEPQSDVIKGVPYLQCAVKLTNVFGRTFALDDNTIETWLSNGGKEAM